MTKNLIVILLALLFTTPSATLAEDGTENITQIRLRSTIRLHADQVGLTLGDLARCDGPQAERLAGLDITLKDEIRPGKWSTIDLESLRQQIKGSTAINFGAIVLQGGEIRITRLVDRDAIPLVPSENAEIKESIDGPTLRSYIERWVYARLKSTPEGTRLTFNERDRDMLDIPTQGRVVELRELGRSDRMAVGVVIYENERIVLESSIRFQALIERPVLVTTAQIKRGTPIGQESTSVETRWLPTTEPIADPQDAMGNVTKSTLDPGTVMLASMLEAPIIVERGQMVSARSIAGSVSVWLKVRAKQSGRLGEVIELESRDRKQKFHARIAGPGRVVIMQDTDAQTATKGRP